MINKIKTYTLYIAFAASIALIAYYIYFFILIALHNIVGFNGPALDGAFQLLNPLRRLDASQAVGRNFQFFHGPLVPLLHFPFFKLFGGGLFGSELSRWSLSPIFFVLTGFIFFWAWFKPYTSSRRLMLSTIGLAALVPITYAAAEVVTPSNSLLGIRTTFPIIVAAIILLRPLERYAYTYKQLRVSAYDLLIYLFVAISIGSGTEQGIAALIAFLLMRATTLFITNKDTPLKERSLKALFEVLKHGIGMLAVTFLLFTAITLGHPFAAFQYVLGDVPKDQFWYYGTMPQGFLTWHNLVPMLTLPYMRSVYIWGVACVALVFIALKLKLLSNTQKQSIFFLFIYALFTTGAMLSYFDTTQAFPFARVLILLTLALALLIATSSIKVVLKTKAVQSLNVSCIIQIVLVSLLVFGTGLTAHKMYLETTYFDNHNSILKKGWQNFEGNHTSLLGPMWTDGIHMIDRNIHRNPDGTMPKLWSTYSSVFELHLGVFNPSSQGHDYIIHALGPERRDQYAKDFINAKPDFVTTIRPSYSIFEEWLWYRHWNFYLPLIENYTIVDKDKAHFLWKRSSTPVATLTTPQKLAINNNQIPLPINQTSSYQIAQVTVTYQTEGIWSKLPFLKNLPRYLVTPVNAKNAFGVGLPPYEKSWTFPVVIPPNQTTRSYLTYGAYGLLPKAKLDITNASYRYIQIDPANLPEFTEKMTANLND